VPPPIGHVRIPQRFSAFLRAVRSATEDVVQGLFRRCYPGKVRNTPDTILACGHSRCQRVFHAATAISVFLESCSATLDSEPHALSPDPPFACLCGLSRSVPVSRILQSGTSINSISRIEESRRKSRQTIGLLQRRHIRVEQIKYIGKESNTIEDRSIRAHPLRAERLYGIS
jgi:hypothetical protein